MNRRLFRSMFFLIILSLILAGCGGEEEPSNLPSDPREAIKEITKIMQEIETTHFTMDVNMDMDAGGLEVNMKLDAEGDMVLTGPTPQDANMEMEMNVSMLGREVQMDMVMLDGETWVREAGGSWQKLPADQANITGGLGADPTATLRYLEQAKEVQKLEDAEIDGVDCYHYIFVMDADALNTPEMIGQIVGSGQLTDEQAQEILETAVLKGEVWAGKEDLLPRQQSFQMNFDISGLPGLEDTPVKYDMQFNMRFSAFNEPVEIKAPLD